MAKLENLVPAHVGRLLSAATKRPGYGGGGTEDKRATRDLLFASARSHLGHAPRTCFTLPSLDATCAEMMRKEWPEARIVCIERSDVVARYSRSLMMGCEMIRAMFGEYVRQPDKLWVFPPGGDAERARPVSFDYPKFDVAFVDLCGLPVTAQAADRLLSDVASFANEHMESKSVLGVTLPVAIKDSASPIFADADGLAREIRSRLSQRSGLTHEGMDYGTKTTHMAFVVFRFG